MFYNLLIFYFFIIPFQWALSPSSNIDLATIRVFSLTLVFIWLILLLLRRQSFFIFPLSFFFAASFLLIAGSSFIWAENDLFMFRKFLFLLNFFPLFFILASYLHEHPSRKDRILDALLLGGASASFFALGIFLSQFLFGLDKTFTFLVSEILPFFLGDALAQSVARYPSLLVNIGGETFLRASGFFPDPHMFSFYLGMLVPLALGRFLLSRGRRRILFALVLGILLLTDLFTFSRGGYVGLFMGAIVFAFGYFSQALPLGKKAFLVAIGLIFIGILTLSGPIGNRFTSSFSLSDGSNMERVKIWKEAWDHISERPLLGVGLGNYPLRVKPSAEYREPIYAHNLYLDIAAELGGVGLGVFLSLLIVCLYPLFVKWRTNRHILALSLLSSIAVFLTHSLFDTALFSVHVLPTLLLILALGV